MKQLLLVLIYILFVAPALAEPQAFVPYSGWPISTIPTAVPHTNTLTLKVVWRLDCGEDADPVVGSIVSAAPGLDGRVLLVDRQLCQVLVVGSEGQVERTVGRRGEKPGELSGAYRALQLADGRIGIANGIPAPGILFGGKGRIVFFDENDNPAGTWLAGGDPEGLPLLYLRDLRNAAGHIVSVTTRKTGSPPNFIDVREVALIDPVDGSRVVIVRDLQPDILTKVTAEVATFEPLAGGRIDVGTSGQVAMAPERERWAVAVRKPDGSGFVVERPWEPVERSEEDIAAVRRALGDPAEYSKVLDDHPAIARVRWRPDGCLWGEPGGQAAAPGALACFDELSAGGELTRRIQLVVPGATAADELLLLEDGRFVLLRGFDSVAESEPTSTTSPEVLLLEM